MRPFHWWIIAGLIVCVVAGMETYRGQVEDVRVRLTLMLADRAMDMEEVNQLRNRLVSLHDRLTAVESALKKRLSIP